MSASSSCLKTSCMMFLRSISLKQLRASKDSTAIGVLTGTDCRPAKRRTTAVYPGSPQDNRRVSGSPQDKSASRRTRQTPRRNRTVRSAAADV